MTFGPDHYVPVLKLKRGEKKALGSIAPGLRPKITPLLEIVARKQDKSPNVSAHLVTAFKDLAEVTRLYQRCLLDCRELEPDGPAAASEAFQRADAEGIVFTPVTGITRTDVSAALAYASGGIAIRLTREEFESGRIPRALPAFLKRHDLEPNRVDLIVDLGAVDELITDGVVNLTELFLADVPDHDRWRTFTISACAFPQSMGRIQGKSEDFLERAEWKAWLMLRANRKKLARLPTFSDCGIQHPKGVEDFDPRLMQASAAIRYTLPESWLLIKGESTKRVPAVEQFPGLATQLVYGHLREHFPGSIHCSGCRSIVAAADGVEGHGAPEVWRRLGTTHHLTRTVEGLVSLL